jgi:hypothetical protein
MTNNRGRNTPRNRIIGLHGDNTVMGILGPDGQPASASLDMNSDNLKAQTFSMELINGLWMMLDLAAEAKAVLEESEQMLEDGQAMSLNQKCVVKGLQMAAKWQVEAKELIAWAHEEKRLESNADAPPAPEDPPYDLPI